MKKVVILCVALLVLLFAFSREVVLEPERCSLCDGIVHHAPCIINLGTGEKIELAVYDPHPFLAGELAEDQRSGYFTFLQGAGVEGYKLGAEFITVTISTKVDKMDQHFFCAECRLLLVDFSECGYVLVDLKDAKDPVVYDITHDNAFSIRCYDVSVHRIKEDEEYEITIFGTLDIDD